MKSEVISDKIVAETTKCIQDYGTEDIADLFLRNLHLFQILLTCIK